MQLTHIPLTDLKPAAINVRKHGGKEIADLIPSIRSLGLIQPLLVRPNCEGYEIVAGQRRYRALCQLAEEGQSEPVPCVVMEDGDDAAAIEASLAENVARLPMDEIDQYKAFAALIANGLEPDEIAARFGVTERLVRQRLAVANLIGPILTAYRREEIDAGTVRILTMATKAQQKKWLALLRSDDEWAPTGRALRQWLLGGASLRVANALFDVAASGLATIGDLFDEDEYFADSEAFWPLQSAAVAEIAESHREEGWADVIVHEIGEHWPSWNYTKASKDEGGEVHIAVANDGEVTVHEGVIDIDRLRKRQKAEKAGGTTPERPELTKAMQRYLDLHRHAVVRFDLLSQPGLALRLAVAQIVAGSELWTVEAEGQKAPSEAIAESLAGNRAEAEVAKERTAIRDLLGIEGDGSIVPHKEDWSASRDLHAIFAKLVTLDDETVLRILAFVVAETLACGSAMVEALGVRLGTGMATYWSPDETFFDLLRDKEAINAMLREVAGKRVADANATATAKVQKGIIRDCLDGTRKGGKCDWQPRYVTFPMRAYTKRGGLRAIKDWNAVKAHHV